MKTVKYLIIVLLFAFSTKSLCQDQSILIFDPNGVSSSFQSTLSQLTNDSIFIADTLDNNIFNYDGLFLFVNYPYIISEGESNKLIQYTAEGKPAYIYSNLLFQPPIDSTSFWHHIGIDEIQGLLISVQVDSLTGIDTTFTSGVFIDTSFISWSVPVVTGNADPILNAWWSGSHFNSTFISGYDSMDIILDLYNLIDEYGFLEKVLQKFNFIPTPVNVQIQFFPPVDTALVNGGCTTPEIICKNLISTNGRDSISIEPGFNTYFYYYDSTGTQIPLDNYYFIVIDSLDEYQYEVWFHPKSWPPYDPVIIPFDSIFYSEQNKYDIQLIVKKNGMRIDSLSQPFHADFGLSVDDQDQIPNEFSLSQNYPNPFNPSTSIQYAVSNRQFVSLKVYDILGNEIAILVSEEKQPGTYEVEFEVRTLPSGIYFCQLKADKFVQTKKMVLLK
jgi:hypothetical protein